MDWYPLLFLAAQATAVPVTLDAQASDIDPGKMTRAQIKVHNQSLPPKDPSYIRCVRYAAPGSLIENKVTCRTNAQWITANRVGEQNARDTAEAMRSRLESPPDSVCRGDNAGC